jgi:diguanylate cyclase (GGDEF)-like protein
VAVFADLNNFKQVNDQLGHEIGDEVLMLAGRIFSDCLRPHGIVGRRSGDEFLALLKAPAGVGPVEWTNNIVAPLTAQLRGIHNVATARRPPGASIGIHIAGPNPDRSARTVFRRADAAMYAAKSNGTPVVYWHPELRTFDAMRPRNAARLRDQLKGHEG